MVDLVVSLSNEKNTWNYVVKLINEHSWDNVIIVTGQRGESDFKSKN